MKSPVTNGRKLKIARKCHLSAIFIWPGAIPMPFPHSAMACAEMATVCVDQFAHVSGGKF